ncbi:MULTISPECIES: AEC family transporter [unclassified Vibrio]|uniref:AEC family transporter n=1 Tax=unclassified Vibrio TaxID=2614977 RepID=UPI0014833E96|nr:MULTISPECIES: AEC family transporter [unclassified Vibrio]NNN44818.1 AEC family transporter [Vibrio sp. 1-1(7)]NNN72191.1 AEC family transporter [Vibrio sp. 12-2(3-a)]
MHGILEQLQFSLSITGPICLMLMLGVFLKRIQLINDNFIDVASRIVFQVTLPAMLFLSIVGERHDFSSSMSLIIFGLIANMLFFLFICWMSQRNVHQPQDQGVVIQGGFRANTAIIGLAYVANIYGNSGVALAAIYVASTTVLYNIQAVIALTAKGEAHGTKASTIILKTLTKNPLIISIVLGMICYSIALPIPTMIADAGHYFANMTLPLALLCTGGSLNIQSLREDTHSAWFATVYKLVWSPILITGAALLYGFRGLDLGIVFLMSGAPTAAASYVMARAMGGNATLAANIIALTTVLSLFTCTFGIFLLANWQLI